MHSLARAHTLDSLLIENVLCQNFDLRAVVVTVVSSSALLSSTTIT
jgi:hypothetical protein